MNRKEDKSYWTTIIKAKNTLFDFKFKELLSSKELIAVLVRRDFVTVYKQTILGPLWFILQPMLTTVMYTFVFGNIAKISTGSIPQPLFYFSGTILWTFFSTLLLKCADTFIANAPMFGKIYFPRLAVPLSYVVTNFITFLIQFSVYVVLLAIYMVKGYRPDISIEILLIPVLLLQTAMIAMGVGMIISALTTKYRDLRNLISFGVSLWMYATPVVYPMEKVPARFLAIYSVNPMAPVVEMFRHALLGGGDIDFMHWLSTMAVALAIFLLGIVVFNRNARDFVDVI